MTAGPAAAVVNSALDSIVGSGNYVKLHVGDPGAAGANNAAAVTTRQSLTWASAANAQKAITNQPQWSGWTGGTQTITHLSVWDAASGGNFRFSVAAATAVQVVNGGNLNLNSLTIGLGPVAA